MLIDKPLDVTGCVDLVHTQLDPLHPFQVGRGCVGECSVGKREERERESVCVCVCVSETYFVKFSRASLRALTLFISLS